MKSNKIIEVVARVIGVIGSNGVIWMVLVELKLFLINPLVIIFAKYSILVAVFLMFMGATYLTYNQEKMKILREVTIVNLGFMFYTICLFLVFLAVNIALV